MSVVALGIRQPAFFPHYDEGRSDEAAELDQSLSALFDSAIALTGQERQDAEHAVWNAASTAAAEGVVLAHNGLSNALGFLWTLPADVPVPEIVIEPDGEVAFDWDEGSQRVLSINFADNGMIGYAGLIGLEPFYGKTPFAGTIPETILYHLARVFPIQSETDPG